jgi:hypothetical protein
MYRFTRVHYIRVFTCIPYLRYTKRKLCDVIINRCRAVGYDMIKIYNPPTNICIWIVYINDTRIQLSVAWSIGRGLQVHCAHAFGRERADVLKLCIYLIYYVVYKYVRIPCYYHTTSSLTYTSTRLRRLC